MWTEAPKNNASLTVPQENLKTLCCGSKIEIIEPVPSCGRTCIYTASTQMHALHALRKQMAVCLIQNHFGSPCSFCLPLDELEQAALSLLSSGHRHAVESKVNITCRWLCAAMPGQLKSPLYHERLMNSMQNNFAHTHDSLSLFACAHISVSLDYITSAETIEPMFLYQAANGELWQSRSGWWVIGSTARTTRFTPYTRDSTDLRDKKSGLQFSERS